MPIKEAPLVFVDLDDTLFQSARKMGQGPGQVAAVDRRGEGICFMSPAQQRFVDWLLQSAEVVPVTARSVEAFSRVRLEFTHGAICSHGAVLLDRHGRIDADWQQRMTLALACYQPSLRDIAQWLVAFDRDRDLSLRSWLVHEQGLNIYAVVKHNRRDPGVLKRVAEALRAGGLLQGYYLHQNDNNLAILPRAVEKRAAVSEWLRRRVAAGADRPLLAFGDSLSDLSFMSLCHWWGTPPGSQISEALAGLPVARGGDD
jgi:hydroxymethylpyrimidine pyrophosphatase-like HAD family hydrolase